MQCSYITFKKSGGTERCKKSALKGSVYCKKHKTKVNKVSINQIMGRIKK